MRETPLEAMNEMVFGTGVSERDLLKQADERLVLQKKSDEPRRINRRLVITPQGLKEMSNFWEFDRELYG